MPDKGAIIAAARSWKGVPWRHQGRSRQGVDCVGLVVAVARDLGLHPVDWTAYRRHAADREIVARFRAQLHEVPLAEAQPGDVLLFREQAYPCHAAILSVWHGVPHIIHAHASRRQVVEEPYAGDWPARATHAFQMSDIRDQAPCRGPADGAHS
ncbi:MAG: C40 family peptidase [Rhodospirillaceae bacterium]|nr:C40 family peptidase [Rhodospirillaceae bacterium]